MEAYPLLTPLYLFQPILFISGGAIVSVLQKLREVNMVSVSLVFLPALITSSKLPEQSFLASCQFDLSVR